MNEQDKLLEINDNPFTVGDDQELDASEQQMRNQYDPNSSVTETQVETKDKPEPKLVSSEPVDQEAPTEEAEEVEAEAEVKAEVKPAEGESKPKVRPWSELRKTRKANDQLTNELEAERKARKDLEARFKIIEQRTAPISDTKQAEAIPEFTKDPLANLKGTGEQTQQQLAAIQQQLQVQQLQAQINADENNYSKEHPDYTEARDWLLEQEFRDAQTVFGALPEEQRNLYASNLVNQRRAILIATARDTKQSVADLAYKVAQARGFQGKASQAAPVAPAAKAPAEQAKERVQAARERETQAQASISNVGSSPTIKSKLSRDDIMGMSEADMDKLAMEDENWDQKVA